MFVQLLLLQFQRPCLHNVVLLLDVRVSADGSEVVDNQGVEQLITGGIQIAAERGLGVAGAQLGDFVDVDVRAVYICQFYQFRLNYNCKYL